MNNTLLARYLDADVLQQIADRPLEPAQLVLGNLAGGHKSPLAGFAVEFAGHREYVPGDDPRHIDWRLYHKRERYFIKQYEMETNYVCHLLLDVSASMRYGDGRSQKLFYASHLAATLAYCIVRQHDKVSLATFDDAVRGYVPPGNSLAQIVKLTQHLDEVSPVEKTRMPECLLELAGRMGRREIVMVFSDFLTDLDALEDVLQRLRYARHEVILFHVLHHDELTFTFNGMVKFEGLESDEILLTQTDDVRSAYLEIVRRFNDRFDDLCRRNRIERVEIDTSRSPADALLGYLNQRELLLRSR
ncbi:MAG TPA: DUF58 domain-containing protein [Planctomycetaceae bacterium]|nr:DUF58 domain-containing protein [Planctomycetaceae bacterium]